MALFDNFPFTDLHNLNLDWVLRKMRELIAEWAAFHADIVYWREDITDEMADLKQFVLNYFDALDLDAIVAEKINDLLESGTFEAMVEAGINKLPHTIIGDLTLNTFKQGTDPGGKFIQGGCYIGDGKIVLYFSQDTSNLGTITCYNLRTKTQEWTYDVEGGHGASLAYHDNTLYISPMFDYSTPSVLLTTLYKVDLSNPTVLTPISMPFQIYSMAYDSGFFYFMTHGNGKVNYNNICTVTDEEFNIVRTVNLQGYGEHPNSRTQGIQCAALGNLYEVLLDAHQINIYNAYTGEHINSCMIEDIFNGFRTNGEQQGLIFDYDENEFYLTSTFYNNGFSRWRTGSVVKLGIHHGIEPQLMSPANRVLQDGQVSANPYVNVVAQQRIAPDFRPGWMQTIDDAVNLSKTYGCALRIHVFHCPADSTTPYEHFLAVDYHANEFFGSIEGQGSANKTPAAGFCFRGSRVILQNFNFNRHTSYTTMYGTDSNVSGVFVNSHVIMTLNALNQDGGDGDVIKFYNSVVKAINDATAMKYHLTNSDLDVQNNAGYDAMPDVRVSSGSSRVTGLIFAPEQVYTAGTAVNIKLHNRLIAFLATDSSTFKIFWVFNNIHYDLTVSYNATTNEIIARADTGANTIEITFKVTEGSGDWLTTLTVERILYDGNEVETTRMYARM